MPKRRRLHQDLPASGAARKSLREKGQFWTPDWVAEAMVSYLLRDKKVLDVFDPAVGAGAFFTAAKKLAGKLRLKLNLAGRELDPDALLQAKSARLTSHDLAGVEIKDFVFDPPSKSFLGIVANPPYIRHHRLSPASKEKLRAFGTRLIGKALDGRAGFHIYFLLRALELLAPSGKLAFIMPADTCEGVFSDPLWRWITKHYKLDAVIAFAPEATPFPRVDTNALVLLISKESPSEHFFWAFCQEPETPELLQWIQSGFHSKPKSIQVHNRTLREGLRTGFSRYPQENPPDGVPLRVYARILRGIATGANEFFLLTDIQVGQLRLPKQFLLPAVGRTRDVPGDEVSLASIEALRREGRAVWLLSLDGREIQHFPKSIQDYLRRGEELGLPQRALIASRGQWYKMEARTPAPPILFAYLGRRNTRFIRNKAGAAPLTGFLCVYPKNAAHTEQLWRALQHPDTIKNLPLVAKSYGAGAIKVEPRSLDRLVIPTHVLEKVGLPAPDVQKEPTERLALV